MSDVLIQCDNVGKKFCRDLKKSLWYGVRDSAADLLRLHGSQRHQLRAGEFWANEEISFELKRGECLGLVGRNGAGKTTLLKMLNGLIKPDRGSICMRGHVGALIALGAGFNPVLTGRENILVNGSILGLSKMAILKKVDEIVEFSELEEFLDTPVRNYSSGMQVRLGFAIAVVLIQPDILILDEVLAVGDAGFRAKCYASISRLLDNAAVILVSHNMEAISRICDRGMFLEAGRVQYASDGLSVSQFYANSLSSEPQNLTTEPGFSASDLRCEPSCLGVGDDLAVRFKVVSPAFIKDPLIKINITTLGGTLVGEFNSCNEKLGTSVHKGENNLCFRLRNLRLLPQAYCLSISVISSRSLHVIWWRNAANFEVHGSYQGHQSYQLEGSQVVGVEND